MPAAAPAQTGQNVLVVANANGPESVEIAEYYARVRSVARRAGAETGPCRLPLPETEALGPAKPLGSTEHTVVAGATPVPDEDFLASTTTARLKRRSPAGLRADNAHDRILFIRPDQGRSPSHRRNEWPHRVRASVDSELALLYRKDDRACGGAGGGGRQPVLPGRRCPRHREGRSRSTGVRHLPRDPPRRFQHGPTSRGSSTAHRRRRTKRASSST